MARVEIPREYRTNPVEFDKFLGRVHRLIMLHYEAQHRASMYGIEFLPASTLRPVEIASEVGLLNKHFKKQKAPARD